MKVSIAIAFSLSLFTTSVVVFATSASENSVHVFNARQKNAFVFKGNKSSQGAKVEVFAANGECITRHRLTKRKMVISFLDKKPGTYTIAVTKHGHREEFKYIRN